MKLEFDAPNIGELEKSYLNKIIDSGFVSSFGPYIPKFEEMFARYLGVRKAVSAQNGTAAIHIALHELGIGPEDEVIVPVLTFVATVNPVIYVGAKPIFVDVSLQTWNIDPAQVEKAVTKKTRAIIPVHLYGNPCDMDKILEIAKGHTLYVIEDATESLGAQYKNRHIGTFGDLGCFSFNGNKTVTTGAGGMVVGGDEQRLEHIKFLVNQAKNETKECYHPEIGFNYRMTNIEAALGMAQMERIDEFLAKKKRFNDIYREKLKEVNFIHFQEECQNAKNSYWLSCIILEKEINIALFQKSLKQKGIPTRRVFAPIIEFPPYRGYKTEDYKNAYYIYEHGLCLPSSTLNSEDDIFYVCKTIKELVQD